MRCSPGRTGVDLHYIQPGKPIHELAPAHRPFNRRTNLRVSENDLGLVEQSLRLQHNRLRGSLLGLALVKRRLGDRQPVANEILGALQLQRRVDLGCLGPRQIGLLLLDCGLVGRLLDATADRPS